ncbi:MAG: hypothetical protein QM529_02085 [Hydrotalea sp.]|nr:hypothetical protein [Hydrotalea sp.]
MADTPSNPNKDNKSPVTIVPVTTGATPTPAIPIKPAPMNPPMNTPTNVPMPASGPMMGSVMPVAPRPNLPNGLPANNMPATNPIAQPQSMSNPMGNPMSNATSGSMNTGARPAMAPTMMTPAPTMPSAPTPTLSGASPSPAAGKDFQALMREMQTINQSPARATPGPVSGGVVNLGAPTPTAGPAMPPPAPRQDGGGGMVGGGDDGYYQDDYYAPPPMSPMMKLFFAVQTLLSIIMVVLLIMMFNMFSGLRSQTITADSMKSVLQSFVDGIANQNKALLDGFAVKMDEMGKGLGALNDSNTKTQESLDAISQKLDKAISRPPVVAPTPKPKPVKKAKPQPAAPSNALPSPSATPDATQPDNNGLDDLNNLPSLPDLPLQPQSKQDNLLNQGTKNATYKSQDQLQDNYQLPPLPEPTPNLFPNN